MLDQFGRDITYLRISVTDRCNLRCRYCMPADGVTLISHDDILSFEEILSVVKSAVDLGITKVRITGGEPLVRKGIVTLVEQLSRIEKIHDLSMSTNGTLLEQFALLLKNAGLQRLNISLDSLNPTTYEHITRGGNVKDVLSGINAAKSAGFKQIKINAVIENSFNEPDALSVARFAEENGLAVQFIRRMDLHSGKFWRVSGGSGGECRICNRIRLSANGFILPCLFNERRFSVRSLGARTALKKAIENKPAEGNVNRTTYFYAIGG